MSRRLPIYFLIDVSESMVGEPMMAVEEGIAAIIKELKSDPYAIETAWLSIIVFAGGAKTLVPLQEIIHFYPPKIPVGSGTSLGKGLGHLMFELRKNLVKTTYDQKGDWKPIVFLFTDGVPTDDTQSVIAEWKQNWERTVNLVAISFGDEADTELLSQLTDTVLLFKNTTSNSYKQFFKWVTDSIKTSSESVENKSTGFGLAQLDNETLSKIDLTKKSAVRVDSNFVVIAGKCQNTKRPYLIKYKRTLTPSGIGDLQTLAYKMAGAFQVDNTYYELSDENAKAQKINTEELMGGSSCPSCGNPVALAMCLCGGIHCVGAEELSTCPWCGTQGQYGVGEGGFDVTRTQG